MIQECTLQLNIGTKWIPHVNQHKTHGRFLRREEVWNNSRPALEFSANRACDPHWELCCRCYDRTEILLPQKGSGTLQRGQVSTCVQVTSIMAPLRRPIKVDCHNEGFTVSRAVGIVPTEESNTKPFSCGEHEMSYALTGEY